MPERIRSLDGLRGLAAAIVVLDHALLSASPRLNAAYLDPSGPPGNAAAWWLVHSPLHAVFNGQGAVLVFFVLSGYVLAAGPAAGRPLRLAAYYPRRLARLYLPVAGAIALAILAQPLIPARPPAGATAWLSWHLDPPTLGSVLENAALIFGPWAWQFTAVLWSMQWEVWFSLLLPAFLLAARIARGVRASVMAAAGSLALVMLWPELGALRFMPAFALGVLLAFNAEAIAALRDRLAGRRWAGAALAVAAAVLLTAPWWVPAGALAARATAAVAIIGAALAVLVALVVPPAGRLLSTRAMQWAGKRSFSMYLVHETVVVALAFALGGAPSLVLLLALALPLVLAVTELFHRLVEAPSHRASRRLGRLDGQASPRHVSTLSYRLHKRHNAQKNRP